MTYDYVVVGAGISGITSALALAKNGFRVALLEKADRTAPLLRGFTRHGLNFDTGFHYAGGLNEGGALDTFFRYLGLSDNITSFPFNELGFDIFNCAADNFEFHFPTGYDRIREELYLAFPKERPAIDSYLAQVRSISASMPYQNLNVPIAPDIMLQRVFGPTLKETLDALTPDPLLKSLLSMHTLLYGVSSSEVSFAQHAVIVGNYYESARGIRGGGLSLALACDAQLEKHSVEVFCGSEVAEITAGTNGAFSGVRLKSGETISSRGCVATLHPQLLLDLIPEGAFRPAYRRRLAALEETVSAFLAYAVCTEPLPSLAGTNLFLLKDAESIHEIGKKPIGEAPLYISGAYRERDSEPSGFIVITPANFSETAQWQESRFGQRPVDYRQFKQQALERIWRQVELLSPDLSGNIRSLEISTPLTIRHFCDAPLGGLYGIKHMVGQYNPSPTTRMKGLYLAGQALVSPGIMGAVVSGLLACGTILGHEHMRKELKACC
ncbi:MAG TPA: NAD(P)/FAD-dependent oxidoreductase [Desulfuromonadaceae bacterium]|jgi:all-trans-retinol 13,14-reductase